MGFFNFKTRTIIFLVIFLVLFAMTFLVYYMPLGGYCGGTTQEEYLNNQNKPICVALRTVRIPLDMVFAPIFLIVSFFFGITISAAPAVFLTALIISGILYSYFLACFINWTISLIRKEKK